MKWKNGDVDVEMVIAVVVVVVDEDSRRPRAAGGQTGTEGGAEPEPAIARDIDSRGF